MNAPIIPIPRSPVTVRVATPADLPFIDSLQKRHAKQVGWMPTKQLEERMAAALELRDRYLEHANTHLLTGEGKYDVSRGIGGRTTDGAAAPAALPALPALPGPVSTAA